MITERNIGLDIIRSLAILFVVFFHLNLSFLMGNLINTRFYIPNGVELFFVLSGYLIGGILIKTIEQKGNGIKQLIEFWCMRWFRTLPNYYLFMVIVFVLFNHAHFKWHNFLFLQNFYKTQNVVHFETWSLAVEEWFYLLFPSILFGILYLIKSKRKSILYTIALFIIVGFCTKYYYIVYHLQIDIANLKMEAAKLFEIKTLVINRMDSICVGVLGAYLSFYYRTFWKSKKWILFLVGFPIFVYCTFVETNMLDFESPTSNAIYWSGFSMLYSISILGLFSVIEDVKISNKIAVTFFTYTSKISYTMYLLHMILLKIFIVLWVVLKFNITPLNLTFFVLVYFVVLYVLCLLNYKYFEKRFIDYRTTFITELKLDKSSVISI